MLGEFVHRRFLYRFASDCRHHFSIPSLAADKSSLAYLIAQSLPLSRK